MLWGTVLGHMPPNVTPAECLFLCLVPWHMLSLTFRWPLSPNEIANRGLNFILNLPHSQCLFPWWQAATGMTVHVRTMKMDLQPAGLRSLILPLSDVAALNESPFPPCLCYFLSLIGWINMVAELGLLAARIQALTLTTPWLVVSNHPLTMTESQDKCAMLVSDDMDVRGSCTSWQHFCKSKTVLKQSSPEN